MNTWVIIYIGVSMITGKLEPRVIVDNIATAEECDAVRKAINAKDMYSDRAICMRQVSQ